MTAPHQRWSDADRWGFQAEVMRVIDTFGHAIQGVFATKADEVSFNYTVGLCKRVGCEFLIAGLNVHLGSQLLNSFADTVTDAYVPVEGALVDVGSNELFQLRQMDASDERGFGRAPVYTATALFGVVPVWQLVWPDEAGAYPPDANAEYTAMQRVAGSPL